MPSKIPVRRRGSASKRDRDMALDFTVTICDPHRQAVFESVFGTATVHRESLFPVRADLSGHPGEPVYMFDLEFITPEQRERLVSYLAEGE